MTPLRLVFVEPKGGGKIQDGVTVTPTKEEQTVEPDPGFDGLGAVTVEAIPDAYQDVTGVDAGAEDIRVGKVGIDAQGNLLNGEMLPRKPEQQKSVVPTKQAQTVSPDSGYALSAVNVAKIPDAYQDVSFVDAEAADIRVGKTGVSATGERLDGQMLPQKPEQTKSVTPTESSQLVEPDSGYALSAVEVDAIPSKYADISGVTAVTNVVKSGYIFVDSEGVETQGTNTDDTDTSDGTMIASQLENGAVGYSQGQRIVGTKPVRTTDVEISDLSPVPIPAGSYDGTASAKLSSAAAADVVASNIRQGAEILGVQGNYEGADTLGQYFDNTLTHVENDSITSLAASFFAYKSALTNASFPALTSTPSYLFRECTGLTEVDVSGATTIGDRTFYNCNKLTSVNIPLATRLNDDAFHYCKRLETVTGDAVTTIMNNVFAGCENLSSINVASWTSLGQGTFMQCYAIPETMVFPLVTAMASGGSGIFYDASVKHLEFPAFLSSINYGTSGVPFRGSNVESIIFDAITNIGQNFFRDAPKLTDLVIRTDSVCTLVNINAFYNSPFAANGTGGTLYCPQSLISQYEQATNWSVILAYPNNQILPIEGSPYEVTS